MLLIWQSPNRPEFLSSEPLIELLNHAFQLVVKHFHCLLLDFPWHSPKRLGDPARDAGHRVGVTTQRDGVPDRVLEVMMRDKKVAHGRLRFVLPTRLGHVELVEDIEKADVLAALEG